MTSTKRYLVWTFWLLLTVGSGTLALFSGITLYLIPKLPEVEALRQIKLQTPLRVYSSDGLLLGEFGEKRRTPIAYRDVPQPFIDAILAAEDDRFYSHPGVDIKGLLRAASQLLKSGQIQTGGSTITMQVARNFFLTRKQTFSRKFNEILLALQIEKELTKQEILELYVNKIYLGNRAYGIQAAAQVYYGKPIQELNLAQLAMIAGLPKAPSAYNPLANPERALVRRNWILGRMQSLGYIDAAALNSAVAEPVTASYHGNKLDLDAPYIAEMARQEAVDRLGAAAYTDGYSIITTVDARLQARAQQAVIDGLMTYDLRHGYRGPEASLATGGDTADNDSRDASDAETSDDRRIRWQAALKDFSTIAGLQAAAVTAVGEQSVDFLLADGTAGSIDWDNGLSAARPYINENSRGAEPEKAADVVAEGDVIRVYRDKEALWHLAQIPAAQAALVALNPENGGLKALVGGLDFNQSHFNRATQATRQPGSNFKPFVYSAALESGMTPATLINDAPIVFDDDSLENTWRPENASGKFYGPTRLRKALYLSRNLVSIRVLQAIGVETAIRDMHRFGFDEDKLPHDLSLALGSSALTPLQVATGYTVFANGGYQVFPYLVDRILDEDGEVVYQATPVTVCRDCDLPQDATDNSESAVPGDDVAAMEAALAAELARPDTDPAADAMDGEPDVAADDAAEPTATDANLAEQPLPLPKAERVMSPQVAYLIDDMLRDVVRRGTGTKAQSLGRTDLAGKTGTTNGPRDAWFSGYNHHIVATTWLGFDQNLPLGRREYGGTSALPIWIEFMQTALEGVPTKNRVLPDGLASVRIDPVSGKRARAGQQDAIFELFRQENLPEYAEENAPEPGSNGISNGGDTLPEELF
ncbi:penicillin-binding protein 1A [Pseudomaricurvus sp. HS19]|uniref:penicillin-binding protein 1A n=1 Tax=Pseudomaricurvus sp. HS19 TaxID=2692626 RepID=UPI0013718429|nr:penicillin-binding protein 1A [Pseudomaricurvus sp. HS19]MYM63581.1 PBP1A family penicillin-binding protein [Pseudomaricurvus sp. HS19]